MKRKKEEIFVYVQQSVLTGRMDGITTEQVALALGLQRSNVSSALNALVKEGRLTKTGHRPVAYGLPADSQDSTASVFDKLIGADTVLASAIEAAQAYLLYPSRPGALMLAGQDETLSFAFARLMYAFACQNRVLSDGTGWQLLNCALVQPDAASLQKEVKSDAGMVLVTHTEVPAPQEMARLIDDACRQKKRIWVFSVPHVKNEDSGAPVIVLPPLSAFGMKEQMRIVEMILAQEAKNTGCDLDISREAFLDFVLYEQKEKLQVLQHEIRSACALAYRRSAGQERPVMHIVVNDLSAAVKDYSVAAGRQMRSLKDLVSGDVLQFDHKLGFLSFDAMRKEIYQIVRQEDERRLPSGNAEMSETGELAKVVDPRLIQMVSIWLEKTKETLHRSFAPQVFYGICLHLNAYSHRSFQPSVLPDDKLQDVVENHAEEYQCAFSLARTLYDAIGLELNTKEIADLAEYLLVHSHQENHPVLLYAFHGSGAAAALADATNALTHLHNAYGFDMDLDKDPSLARQQLEQLVRRIDRGAGIVAIYDMGSFRAMLESISAAVKTVIRCIYMPVTLWGLDLARMCARTDNADDVYHGFMLENRELRSDPEKKQQVIVTLCQTGEGGAMELKRYIDQYSHLGMPAIAMSIDNREQLARRIEILRRTCWVHAFVGTFNPHMFGIPFIPVSRIFANPKEVLDQVLTFAPVRTSGKNYDQVYEFLQGEFRYASIPRLKELLPGVVDTLRDDYGLNDQQEDGIFIHIACAVERILAGKPAPSVEKEQKDKVWRACRDDLNNVARIMRRLEKGFHLVFADDDLVTLVIMLKHL